MGAMLTQRPDLFGAVLCDVGVLDMLRYQHFTGGNGWIPEYGSADAGEAAFRSLAAYSPYHNVRPGEFPATLISTGDHDDRVYPGSLVQICRGPSGRPDRAGADLAAGGRCGPGTGRGSRWRKSSRRSSTSMLRFLSRAGLRAVCGQERSEKHFTPNPRGGMMGVGLKWGPRVMRRGACMKGTVRPHVPSRRNARRASVQPASTRFRR